MGQPLSVQQPLSLGWNSVSLNLGLDLGVTVSKELITRGSANQSREPKWPRFRMGDG